MCVMLNIRKIQVPERHVPDCHIKAAILKVILFKTLDRNIRVGIDRLRDTSRNAVYLNAVQLTVFPHILGHSSEKVTHTARRFKDVSALKSELLQSLINAVNNNRRSEKRIIYGRTRGSVLFIGQKLFKLRVFVRP